MDKEGKFSIKLFKTVHKTLCFPDEMIEEHLDEEYQSSEMEKTLDDVETQIRVLENKTKTKNHHDPDFHEKLRKAITLLRLNVQNYQRIIIFNRRRAKQRLRKRQCTLRNLFLQSLMEMQIRIVEFLPLAVEPEVFIEYNKCKENIESKLNDNCAEDEVESVEGGLSFYEDIVSSFTEDQWLDTFHMSKSIFTLICNSLKASFDDINMHYESLMAMCIYTIATGTSFRGVGMLFNVEQTFVRSSLYKFVECFLNEFSDSLLKMPKNEEELDRIAEGFQRASNMAPFAVGVLSVFELPTFSYCGRNKSYGMDRVIVQVCIDYRLQFRKVEIAHQKPSMFLRSPNDISTIWKKLPNDTLVPYFIVAPPLYPLRTWLMQKYDNPSETWEHNFNKSFESLNIFREVALHRLFGRWKILSSAEFIEPESKSLIVKACCALHNLLEEDGQKYSTDWSNNVNLSKYNYKVESNVTMYYNDSGSAIIKRDTIAQLVRSSNI